MTYAYPPSAGVASSVGTPAAVEDEPELEAEAEAEALQKLRLIQMLIQI